MELVYKNVALGRIAVTNRETFWLSGDFFPYPGASEFEDFFAALVCEDGFDEARFDERKIYRLLAARKAKRRKIFHKTEKIF